jgi:hypothetical protein
MMKTLVRQHDWQIKTMKGGCIAELAKRESDAHSLEWLLCYDLGWNLFELITPTDRVGNRTLFDETCFHLQNELYTAAKEENAEPVIGCADESDENTLMLPDDRDQVWLELDGPALQHIGHIASVHYNIDLVNVAEGMAWMERLNSIYRASGWPPTQVRSRWSKYLNGSQARYESTRYGPPPTRFDDYLELLCAHKVVMQRISDDGSLTMVPAPQPLAVGRPEGFEEEMFLRSVWWWSRLRVRGRQLVLEIRGTPRQSDDAIHRDWTHKLSPALGI